MRYKIFKGSAFVFVSKGLFYRVLNFKVDLPTFQEISELQKYYYDNHPCPESNLIEHTFESIRKYRKDIVLYSYAGHIVVPKRESLNEIEQLPQNYPQPPGLNSEGLQKNADVFKDKTRIVLKPIKVDLNQEAQNKEQL